MVVDAEQEEAPILRRVEVEEIGWVVLLMDDRVGTLGADCVAQRAARAVLIVEPDIEQVPAVGPPFQRAVTVGNAGIDQSTASGLDDFARVELRALGIDSISDQAVVGAVDDAGDAEIGMGLRQRIAVEENLLLPAVPGLSTEERMLAADDEARVVGEGPIGRRVADIVLLDAALHLGEERFLGGARGGPEGR